MIRWLTITPNHSDKPTPNIRVVSRFKKFAGQIQLVGEKPESSQVSVDIEMDSVETDEKRLATHLKSADFFDVAKFPKATFVSTEIKPGGEKGTTHTVTGNLDMHGVKKSITFPATISVSVDGVVMQSEFVINHKDFGIVYPGPAALHVYSRESA